MLGCGEDGSALRSIEDIRRPGSGETEVAGRELIGQEIQVLPSGEPRSLQPGDGLSQVPALFTPQQVQRLEEMQSKAPFLYQQRPLPALPASTIRATTKPERTEREDATATALEGMQQLQWQMEKDRMQMVQMMNAMTEENLRLRMQLMEEREARYNTPENLSAGGVDARREELPPPAEADVNDGGSDDLQQEEVPHEQTAGGGGTSEGTSTEQAMTLMLKIVQSMHQMQEQLLKGQTGKKSAKEDGPEETEVIRRH